MKYSIRIKDTQSTAGPSLVATPVGPVAFRVPQHARAGVVSTTTQFRQGSCKRS